MKNLLSAGLLFLLSVTTTFAQSATEDFHIRVYGGTDTEAPTAPTLLTVDPVAPTQIDISWSTSTDNFVVSGYTVMRGSTTIATTTQLSYSDTGLTELTTYTYSVRAFDEAGNYSSSSNGIAATTPEIYVPPRIVKYGNVARIVLDRVYVDTGVSTTSLHLTTARPTRLEVRWGRSASYELGYVVSNAYKKDHEVFLTGLEPGTKYEYEVIGYTQFGLEAVLKRGTFTTMTERLVLAPENVARFLAYADGDDVELSWQFPPAEDISHVRIVRSHLGFPEHPHNGAIVYQGQREQIRDVGALRQYSPIYYTAFVYDTDGNVSSGAIVLVYAAATNGDGVALPPGVGATMRPTDQATSSVNLERVTVDMQFPELGDITVRQGQLLFTMLDRDMTLSAEYPFVLSVPIDTVAGNLKSLIATIVDPTHNRQQVSYLLRLNHDGTAYEARIAAPGVAGESQLLLEIYDYEAFVVADYQTPLWFTNEVSADVVARGTGETVLERLLGGVNWPLFGGAFFVLLIALLIVALRLRH